MRYAAGVAVLMGMSGAAHAQEALLVPPPPLLPAPLGVAVPNLLDAPEAPDAAAIGPQREAFAVPIGQPTAPAARDAALAPYVRAGLGRAPRDLDGAGHFFVDDEAVAYQVSAGAARPAGRGRIGAEVAYLGARDLEIAREGDVEVRFKGPKVQVTYAFSF